MSKTIEEIYWLAWLAWSTRINNKWVGTTLVILFGFLITIISSFP